MSKNQDTGNLVPDRNSARAINRREMVRRLMLAGGAGFALPATGEADAHRLAVRTTPGKTASKTAETNRPPEFLDPHQYQTLAELAERMIPGSAKAQVSSFIDLLLSVDTRQAQTKFLQSLSAFEAESLQRFSRPFKNLTEARQNEILTFASTVTPGRSSKDQPLQITLHDHFENLKAWISGAYYSSEIGMKEMGWTGQVYFTSFPGCQQSGVKRLKAVGN